MAAAIVEMIRQYFFLWFHNQLDRKNDRFYPCLHQFFKVEPHKPAELNPAGGSEE